MEDMVQRHDDSAPDADPDRETGPLGEGASVERGSVPDGTADGHRADDPGADARRADDLRDDEVYEAPAPDLSDQPAVVRRHVKMRTFLLGGLLVGVLLTLVLTFGVPENPSFVPADPTLQFTKLQVFAFLAVFVCPIMLGVGGLVGYIVGNVVGRRGRDVVLRSEARGDDA